MKNKLLVLALLPFLFSCKKALDRDIITNLSEHQVLASYDYTKSRLSAIYTVLPEGFLEIDGAMLESATDNAEHTLETSNIQKFNTGAWNSYDNPDDVWNKYYAGIRLVNQFLATADSVNLDVYRLDPDPAQQIVYHSRLADIKQWKYEARFLRAFFYQELIKRYGGVPIITRVYGLNEDASAIKRNSLTSSVDFVSGECDSAANNLPATYGTADLGRATKGAALALKSRILLYKASDLFNTPSWAGGYQSPENISIVGGDRTSQWKAAADAAKAVIDLTAAGYALHSSYSALFKTFNSPEIILVRRDAATNTFEHASYPIGYDQGQSGTTPSENLVSTYEVKINSTTSAPFDWNNAAYAADPYTNRDPRLAMTVVLNNTNYLGRPVQSYTGGLDGKGKERATKTGYYLRKYVDENLNLLTGTTSIHSWILIRLAEIYLNYAEALNEYSPGNPDIKTYYDRVRNRAGVAMPGLPAGLSQSDVRQKIRNERRIELAFEDQRPWDVRRWMIGSTTLGAPLQGVEITKTGAAFTYKPITVENRNFANKMYLYPIPQSEIFKATGLVQNPQW